MNLLLLMLGLALLIAGADRLVRGASAIAFRMRVSEMTVGLTIVAFGTSMPELVVSLTASVQDHADLAVTNVLGSNIANVLVILGVAALVRPLPVSDTTVLTEIPIALIAALLTGFLANVALFIQHAQPLALSRIDGLILLFYFALFLAYVFRVARHRTPEAPSLAEPEVDGVARAVAWIVVGLAALFLGGKWVLEGAVDLAESFGVSESLVGLTLVAVGTSLPELFASAMAAYRGNTDIAVGNVVGSNIFNLLWILGACALFQELPFNTISNTDLAMVVLATTLLPLAVALSPAARIERWHGLLFIVIYGLYLHFIVQRG